MIVDLPPHIEQLIINKAQIKGMSVADLMSQKFANIYLKGDIRRLKGIAKSDTVVSLEKINEAIVGGAILSKGGRCHVAIT